MVGTAFLPYVRSVINLIRKLLVRDVVCVLCSDTEDQTVPIIGEGCQGIRFPCAGYTPVSYTHLDVYKRQVCTVTIYKGVTLNTFISF